MPLNQMPVKQNPRWPMRTALALLPMLLVAGCASKSPPSLPPVKPVNLPALPEQARQLPQDQLPSICWPSCTAGLTKLRDNWLQSLTMQESVVLPASASTTR